MRAPWASLPGSARRAMLRSGMSASSPMEIAAAAGAAFRGRRRFRFDDPPEYGCPRRLDATGCAHGRVLDPGADAAERPGRAAGERRWGAPIGRDADGGEADAARRAGDDDDAVAQRSGHDLPPR